MALVKSPLMSLEAAGSIGGMTISKSPAGPVAKTLPIPNDSIRGFRPTVRAILSYLARKWGGLTEAQRASWIAWAQDHPGTNKFGDPFIMSGLNAYIMLNHQAIRLGGPGSENSLPPEDVPASEIEELTAVTGAGNPGDVDLTWTELGTGAADDFWEIQVAGPFQSPGRVEVISRFAFWGLVAGNVLLDTVDALDEGFYYWFRVRYVTAEGQAGVWVYAQATPKVTI